VHIAEIAAGFHHAEHFSHFLPVSATNKLGVQNRAATRKQKNPEKRFQQHGLETSWEAASTYNACFLAACTDHMGAALKTLPAP
jgi:hypothetical protein